MGTFADPYAVRLSPAAAKVFERLVPDDRDRIRGALLRLIDDDRVVLILGIVHRSDLERWLRSR